MYCCKDMEKANTFNCNSCLDKFDCVDTMIHRRKDGTYGIIVHDGGTSIVEISFCPWCGVNLTPAMENDNEDFSESNR